MSFRYLTAGESHGRCLVAVIEGLPAGLAISSKDIDCELRRRQQGYGRGARMAIEKDRVEILSGVRRGKSTGSPVALRVDNRDWASWSEVMSPGEGAAGEDRSLRRPRPGHADLAGGLKYGLTDMRDVLERASARGTATRVAVGAVAGLLLKEFGIVLAGHVVVIGRERSKLKHSSVRGLQTAASRSVLNCADPRAEKAMMEEIDRARRCGDSLGGVFEVIVTGVPAGLGS